jgi:hypothetical protein
VTCKINEVPCYTRVYPKVSGLSHDEIEKQHKGLWRQNSVFCESSQNSDTTAPSGRELYHLQFSLQAVSPETSGYTLIGAHLALLYSSRVRIFSWALRLQTLATCVFWSNRSSVSWSLKRKHGAKVLNCMKQFSKCIVPVLD